MVSLVVGKKVKTDVIAAEVASDNALEDQDGVYAFAAHTIEAMLKSGAILSRGLGAFNNAWLGATCMTVDDGRAAAKALLRCGTVPHCMELQAELTKLNVGRALTRALLLLVMSVQVAEESLFPLISRMNAAFGLLASARAP